MLNPYLESKRKIFDEVVAAFSAPIAPEPHEEPIRADPEELDKAVEFFHATLQKYGQQVVQRIGQVRGRALCTALTVARAGPGDERCRADRVALLQATNQCKS